MIPKTKTLNNGMIIPSIGLGTSRMVEPEEVIYYSIKDGARLIDTASDYYNEDKIGKGIERALKEGICKREDLTIIGKIWIKDKKDPEKALQKTLDNLLLDYIDIYVDHYPVSKDYREDKKDTFEYISIYDFWPNMEKLVEKGLAKSIGLSNYDVQTISNLLSFCKIRPVILEVEFNLFFIQNNIKDFCKKTNIALIAYYPMPYGNSVKKCLDRHPEYNIFDHHLIQLFANKYNATPGQIILNWHLKNGVIPIPGTSKKIRMEENLDALKINMEDKDVEKLSQYFRGIAINRFCGCKRFFGINLFG